MDNYYFYSNVFVSAKRHHECVCVCVQCAYIVLALAHTYSGGGDGGGDDVRICAQAFCFQRSGRVSKSCVKIHTSHNPAKRLHGDGGGIHLIPFCFFYSYLRCSNPAPHPFLPPPMLLLPTKSTKKKDEFRLCPHIRLQSDAIEHDSCVAVAVAVDIVRRSLARTICVYARRTQCTTVWHVFCLSVCVCVPAECVLAFEN